MTTDISVSVRWDPATQQEVIDDYDYDGGNSSSRLFERSRIKALAGIFFSFKSHDTLSNPVHLQIRNKPDGSDTEPLKLQGQTKGVKMSSLLCRAMSVVVTVQSIVHYEQSPMNIK